MFRVSQWNEDPAEDSRVGLICWINQSVTKYDDMTSCLDEILNLQLSFVCTRFVARRGEEMRGRDIWEDDDIIGLWSRESRKLAMIILQSQIMYIFEALLLHMPTVYYLHQMRRTFPRYQISGLYR